MEPPNGESLHGETQTDPLYRWKVAGLIAIVVIATSVPLHAIKESRARAASRRVRGDSLATYVGRESCARCHESADSAWRGSDHDRAMAIASDSSVLGDFDDAVFEYGDIRARFYRRSGKYYVYTQDPDGEPAEFEIGFTIGFRPLQQYLVVFPGGRQQALSIAWDTNRGAWFYLYPDERIRPGDWRHWTGGGQTWNSMCAECHSTNLTKGYDPGSKTYSTSWSEIDVSCEACHGPGSRHVAWAEVPPMARAPSENYELVVNTSDMTARQETELCAPCHSRRTELGDYDHGQTDLLESVVPSLLDEGLYFADGQIFGEVYDYGSFMQSKMLRSGVSCSDCHDVHSLRLVEQGNQLCLRCHHASTYDSRGHHFHKKVYRGEPSDAALCVKCHMPERFYMVVDRRADHSIRSPRPDLTLEIGVPNACSQAGCHDDKSAEWNARRYNEWYGTEKKAHYGTALAAGREGRPEAEEELASIAGDTLYSVIVRATALSLLASYPGDRSTAVFASALKDREELIRYTAARAVSDTSAEGLSRLLAPLLLDKVRAVRLAAAARLAGTPAGLLQDYQREALDTALTEFQQAMQHSLDLPVAGFDLGNLYLSLRDTARAEEYFRTAIEIDDSFWPAKMNLAVVLMSRGEYDEAESLLRQVLAGRPRAYEAAYSLGLALAETGRYEEAATYLRLASDGMPQHSRIFYNLGLVEQETGRRASAEDALRTALKIEPHNLDYLYALADHYVRYGELDRALEVADRMITSHPDSEAGVQVRMFIEEKLLESALGTPGSGYSLRGISDYRIR